MGLAPYGNPRYINTLNEIFWNEKTDKPTIADINIYSKKLVSRLLESRLGFPPRGQDEDTITQKYADLASSIQLFLETKVEYLLGKYINTLDKQRVNSLVLSGGVALN